MEMIETKNDEYVRVGVLLITSLIALSREIHKGVPAAAAEWCQLQFAHD
jgi:hypothetical protein